MSKVIIIGAGGVGNVVAHKCAQSPNIFSEIVLASRTLSKCEAIAQTVYEKTGRTIKTYALDADDVTSTIEFLKAEKPNLLINVALPYQDLPLMDACLEAKVDYLDTANYEPPNEAKFEYKWQWAYQDRFKEAGLTALLGSGHQLSPYKSKAKRFNPSNFSKPFYQIRQPLGQKLKAKHALAVISRESKMVRKNASSSIMPAIMKSVIKK